MYTLASKFLDSPTDTAKLVRKSHKSTLVNSAQGATPRRKHDPFKLARLPGETWSEYQASPYKVTPPYATDPTPSIAGSSRDPLPPIPLAKESPS